jgi:hypothetical protein
MSSLKVAAEEYVAIRRSTGFKFEQAANLLSDFVSHLEKEGSTVITSTAAISWASAVGGQPNWWAQRLSVVRGFARYMQGLEPAHQVPPDGVFPTRPCRATPYLYSADDVVRLMVAARSLRSSWARTWQEDRQSDASAFHSNSSDRQEIVSPRKRGGSRHPLPGTPPPEPNLRCPVFHLYGLNWVDKFWLGAATVHSTPSRVKPRCKA